MNFSGKTFLCFFSLVISFLLRSHLFGSDRFTISCFLAVRLKKFLGRRAILYHIILYFIEDYYVVAVDYKFITREL